MAVAAQLGAEALVFALQPVHGAGRRRGKLPNTAETILQHEYSLLVQAGSLRALTGQDQLPADGGYRRASRKWVVVRFFAMTVAATYC